MRRLTRLFPVISGGAAVPWYLAGGVAATNCIAAYQPKGAASYAASKINLANPGTYDAVDGAAPGWATGTGWDGSALSGKYLTTGIVATAGTWSAIVRFTNAGSVQYPFGCFTASKQFTFIPNYAAASIRYFIIATTRVVAPHLVSGVVGIAGLQGYRDGVADGTPVTGTPIATDALFLMTANDGGSPSASWFRGQVQAIAFYDVTLSAPQIAAITTAINLV